MKKAIVFKTRPEIKTQKNIDYRLCRGHIKTATFYEPAQ